MDERVDQIAKEYLRKATRSGVDNIMALCPFHRKADGREEKTPSFAMNTRNGLWYCHSCHARGNLYTFLREVGLPREEISERYQEVLASLGRNAQEEEDRLVAPAPTTDPLPESFLGLFDAPEEALGILTREGYPYDLLRKFDIGFDEKHRRVTFPIRDWKGRLFGISGRALGDALPRYKIYDREYLAYGFPQRNFEKRFMLWNVHGILAQSAFELDPTKRFVVVTEGFKSTLRGAQAGIQNTVGILGSYLSREQQRLLERLGYKVFLMLDNNSAGRIGQRDAGMRLIESLPHVYVIHYQADQPSSLTPDEFYEAVQAPQLFTQWLAEETARERKFF